MELSSKFGRVGPTILESGSSFLTWNLPGIRILVHLKEKKSNMWLCVCVLNFNHLQKVTGESLSADSSLWEFQVGACNIYTRCFIVSPQNGKALKLQKYTGRAA